MRYITFDAPSANEAYAQAPDLAQELTDVMRIGEHAYPGLGERPTDGSTLSVAEHREFLLRQAAALDRLWWRDRIDGVGQRAASAAFDLLLWDRQHGDDVAGPIGPDSIEWDAEGGPRAYVRQEYRHWLTVPPGCADPCPETDPCPWHGGDAR